MAQEKSELFPPQDKNKQETNINTDLEKDLAQLRILRKTLKNLSEQIRDKRKIYEDKLKTLNSPPAAPLIDKKLNETKAPVKPEVKQEVHATVQSKSIKASANIQVNNVKAPVSAKVCDEKTRSIFVQGNFRKVHSKDLIEHFMQYGRIVNFRCIPNESRPDIIFIKYLTYEAAANAVCCKKHLVKGVSLTVKKAKDF